MTRYGATTVLGWALVAASVTGGCGRPSVSGAWVSDQDRRFGKVRLALWQAGDGAVAGSWQANPRGASGMSGGLGTTGTVLGKAAVQRHWYGATKSVELTLLLESTTADPYAGCILSITHALVAEGGAGIDAPYRTMRPQCPDGEAATGRWNLVRE